MMSLQRACEIQVAVDMSGKPVIPVSLEIAEKTERLLGIQMSNNGGLTMGQMEFNAMRRLVDKVDSSYNDL